MTKQTAGEARGHIGSSHAPCPHHHMLAARLLLTIRYRMNPTVFEWLGPDTSGIFLG
eukprot:COSAG02_NODE_38838_length_424_cov_0.812308_1_plen_56_part_10